MRIECPDCGDNHPYPCRDGTCDCCESIERIQRLDERPAAEELRRTYGIGRERS